MAAAAALLVGVVLTFAAVGLFGGGAGPGAEISPKTAEEPFDDIKLPPSEDEPGLSYGATPDDNISM